MNDPTQRAPLTRRGAKGSSSRAGSDNHTPSLFDGLDEGRRRRRDDGTRTAEHAAHPWVKSAVDRAIADRAASRVPFVSDDIRDDVPLLASSPNVLGARINAASRNGTIHKTGRYLTSRNASRHGGVVAEWVGGDA